VEDVRNNYGAILHLALQIVKAEDKPDKNLLKQLEWIKKNTTARIMTNYFVVVHTIARKMISSLRTPIEVKISARRTREFELGELISEIEDAHIKINEIVREVAKKYSLDIAFTSQGTIKIPEIKLENK